MTTPAELYIPPGCKTLDKVDMPQIRLGIQGFPGTGKTWGALTFPNPIVANFDRGVGAHFGRTDVIEIPFHDERFCKEVYSAYTGVATLKETMIKWLETEGKKLAPNQTLVWDGGTATQFAYHKWYEANKYSFLTKQNKIDEFAEWNQKLNFFGEICQTFKVVRCHVIYITHEAERPDKPATTGQPGEYTGKIRPLLSGAFRDQLPSHFTDFFRQHSQNKKPVDEVKEEALALWKMSKDEFKQMNASFPDNTLYYWQTEGDDTFDAKRGSLVNAPRYLPANFTAFSKWMRK